MRRHGAALKVLLTACMTYSSPVLSNFSLPAVLSAKTLTHRDISRRHHVYKRDPCQWRGHIECAAIILQECLQCTHALSYIGVIAVYQLQYDTTGLSPVSISMHQFEIHCHIAKVAIDSRFHRKDLRNGCITFMAVPLTIKDNFDRSIMLPQAS